MRGLGGVSMSHHEKVRESGTKGRRYEEKEDGGGGGRKRPLKCEFSAAKETRAAPLPVIGLAPFPKNPPSSAHHLPIPHSILPLLLSLHLTLPVDWLLLYTLLFPGLCWSMAKREG